MSNVRPEFVDLGVRGGWSGGGGRCMGVGAGRANHTLHIHKGVFV